jgi:signal transduction histidine kinase/CheY-like chemotaxis protein
MTPSRPPELPLVTVALRDEADVVQARHRARRVAELLGGSTVEQTRFATAVSEVARNAVELGGGGRVELRLLNASPPSVVVRVESARPTVRPVVAEGMVQPGAGLPLARRLVDHMEIVDRPQAPARITLSRRLTGNRDPLTAAELRELTHELARQPFGSPLEELQRQQEELLAVLADLNSRQEALAAANSELEETNRGVVALYGQLDDQAQRLRQADAAKDRFISYLSHEFRTPLHAMIAISRLLLEHSDGPLTDEQTRQVELIAGSADGLLGLVNDILDLAKMQAGRLDVVTQEVTLGDVLATLRVLFRPLAVEAGLELLVDEEPDLPVVVTDAQKLGQILRNLLGNAIKFTERGQVRLLARRDGSDAVCLAVQDTGIGIAPEAQERIFEEYEQVRPAPGQRSRGTGLGLPLSRRLAALLGGGLSVESAPGRGSTFTLRLPLAFAAPRHDATASAASVAAAAAAPAPIAAPRARALVVEDDEATRYLLSRQVAAAGWEVTHLGSAEEALERLAREPGFGLLTLDLGLPGMSGFELLEHSFGFDPPSGVHVVICTAAELSPAELERLQAAAEAIVDKRQEGFDQRVHAIAAELLRQAGQGAR